MQLSHLWVEDFIQFHQEQKEKVLDYVLLYVFLNRTSPSGCPDREGGSNVHNILKIGILFLSSYSFELSSFGYYFAGFILIDINASNKYQETRKELHRREVWEKSY